MHTQLGAHLCRFGTRALVWITATQLRDIDWLAAPESGVPYHFFISIRWKRNTGYHMGLQNHHVPVLLIHTVHEFTGTEGIPNTKTVAQAVPDRLRSLVP